MVIETWAVRLFGASAMAIWPFILIDPDLTVMQRHDMLVHEGVHLRQQLWVTALCSAVGVGVWIFIAMDSTALVIVGAGLWGALDGWFLGVLLWRALYLCFLPVGWNPLRWRWEMAAYRKQGLRVERIREILRGKPYFLWWM